MAGKAMIVSVGTGKEGKDIAHGICFSIRQHNPDLLIFLNTQRSQETTMPHVIEYCALKGMKWRELEFRDVDDVENITVECQSIIQSLIKEGYAPNDMVVDYTSGTKAMSAGLTIAAVREKVGMLTYTTGKRGEGGRVISGTERVLSLVPTELFAADLFREAIDSFNSYHFDVSLRILTEIKSFLSDPEFLAKISKLETLCRAYAAWDRFEIAEAFEILKAFREEAILIDWGIDQQVQLNKQALFQEKEKTFCLERAFDLLENARRRGDEERKFDDAVARLYRLCEYIAQFHLNEQALYKTKNEKPDTSDIDLSKIPTYLHEKFSKYTDSRDGKVKIPLSGNYDLLYDLSHPVGKFFKEKEALFKKLMGLRDLSILAHGFNSVSEQTYRDMLRLIENFVDALKFGESNVGRRVIFPKIRIGTIS